MTSSTLSRCRAVYSPSPAASTRMRSAGVRIVVTGANGGRLMFGSIDTSCKARFGTNYEVYGCIRLYFEVSATRHFAIDENAGRQLFFRRRCVTDWMVAIFVQFGN